MKNIKKTLFKAERMLAHTESTILVFSIITMILMGALQVVLRNIFNTGIEWADMFVRSLVLWTGFIGASLATRRGHHINIDVMSKLITSEKITRIRKRIVDIISLVLVFFLLKASIEFLIAERENEMKAFLGIPTWIIFLIVPIAFSIMFLRLIIISVMNKEIEEDHL